MLSIIHIVVSPLTLCVKKKYTWPEYALSLTTENDERNASIQNEMRNDIPIANKHLFWKAKNRYLSFIDPFFFRFPCSALGYWMIQTKLTHRKLYVPVTVHRE